MSLQTRIDDEGSGELIHRANHERALNLQKLDALGQIIPMVVVLDLSQKRDGALCVVRIELRHVEVIDEVDESVLADWAVSGTTLLLKLGHKLAAKRVRISVVVHVNDLTEVVVSLLDKLLEETLDHLRLTATSLANEQWAVADGHELTHEVRAGNGVDSRDRVRLNGLAGVDRVDDVHVSKLDPLVDLRVLDIDVVVEHSLARELDGLEFVGPPFAELLTVVLAVGHLGEATSDAPDGSEHEDILEGLDLTGRDNGLQK